MAWIGAAIGGAASLAGGLFSSGANSASMANYDATQLQMQQNAENYNTQMADTEYQRAVSSMQAAGLNPALAYQQGGIGVPAAPMPNLQPIPNGTGAAIQQGVNGAMAGANTAAQVNLQNAQADKVRADTATTMAQLPFAGGTAQQNLTNMQATEHQIDATVDNLAESRPGIRAGSAAAWQSLNQSADLFPLVQQIQKLDFQRLQLGMPRVENDATWQKAHPALSGWLQSNMTEGTGAVSQGVSTAGKLADMAFGAL